VISTFGSKTILPRRNVAVIVAENFKQESGKMKFVTKALVAGLILTAGIAFAGKSTDPDAKARQDLMDIVGKNTGVLGDMAGGKAPFDAAAAEAAKAAIIEAAGKIPEAFKGQGTDAESKAKPEVWANWDEFVEDSEKLGKAATDLDASSLETVQAGMAGLGGVCKDCHTEFRL
jgi:cytochrome c556